MRMNPESDEESAADLLLRLPEEKIAAIIFKYGEERNSRRIARWIVESREQGKPITTTKELADLVMRAAGKEKTGTSIRQREPFKLYASRLIESFEDLAGSSLPDRSFTTRRTLCCYQLPLP